MDDKLLEQKLLSSLNNGEDINGESYTHTVLFLSRIEPDPQNARYFPTVLLSDEDVLQFANRKVTKRSLVKQYDAEDKVLVGKGCFINAMKYGSADWSRANSMIQSIVDLGNNIRESEIIYSPTVFPSVNQGNYRLITGHRRYFALVYAYGASAAVQFKLYQSQPLLSKTQQFVENASREDLHPAGKLKAFTNALMEINALNKAKLTLGQKKLTVRETVALLGISMGAYDNYNVLTRYPAILDAYEDGTSRPFVSMKKLVLGEEKSYKEENNVTTLSITDKRKINRILSDLLSGALQTNKKQVYYKVKPLNSIQAIKTLLTKDVTSLDSGIDWQALDWNDNKSIASALTTLIAHLNNQTEDL